MVKILYGAGAAAGWCGNTRVEGMRGRMGMRMGMGRCLEYFTARSRCGKQEKGAGRKTGNEGGTGRDGADMWRG